MSVCVLVILLMLQLLGSGWSSSSLHRHTEAHVQRRASSQCSGNLYVGGATNYGFRETRLFLLSYNVSQAAQDSTLILIFGSKQKTDPTLTSFLSLFKNIAFEPIYLDPVNNTHIGNFRFKWLLDFLQTDRGRSYCNVASLDTRDVYFQSDFFREVEILKREHEVSAGTDYVLLAQEGGGAEAMTGKPMNTCVWHQEAAGRPCIAPLIDDYTTFMQNPMICSGTITGTPVGLVVLLSAMDDAMRGLSNVCMKMSMTDQIVLNMVVYEAATTGRKWINEQHRRAYKKLRVLIPGNYANPMFTLGHVPTAEFTVGVHSSGSHMVIGLLPSVNKYRAGGVPGLVHQYDRYEALGRALRTQLQAAKGQKYGDSAKEKKNYKGPPRLFD